MESLSIQDTLIEHSIPTSEISQRVMQLYKQLRSLPRPMNYSWDTSFWSNYTEISKGFFWAQPRCIQVNQVLNGECKLVPFVWPGFDQHSMRYSTDFRSTSWGQFCHIQNGSLRSKHCRNLSKFFAIQALFPASWHGRYVNYGELATVHRFILEDKFTWRSKCQYLDV